MTRKTKLDYVLQKLTRMQNTKKLNRNEILCFILGMETMEHLENKELDAFFAIAALRQYNGKELITELTNFINKIKEN